MSQVSRRPDAAAAPAPEAGVDLDPRVVRTRAAVLAAAVDLLVEGGPDAVTIDAIVARSGVAKSTIYRHWESRDDVLVEAIASCAPVLARPDPASGAVDGLRALLHAVVAYLNDEQWARMLPAILLLKHHAAGIADLEHRLERQHESILMGLLERAADEGLLPASLDRQEAFVLLLGPLVFAHLTGSVPVDDALADRVLDGFLAAHRPDRT